VGGPQARVFLESIQKESGFLGRIAGEHKEDMALVKTLLEKMKP
jgi:hypothetical protein